MIEIALGQKLKALNKWVNALLPDHIYFPCPIPKDKTAFPREAATFHCSFWPLSFSLMHFCNVRRHHIVNLTATLVKLSSGPVRDNL